ncbi:hypothetical protein DIL11_22630 [Salmonella enterica]|uniref:Uncharacterized protein n=1 Tax=Salmonella enterica subsp. enterica serovar Cerro TaxID=340188 RepID=A0A5W5I7K2_SALET|nr:hypothetical protein [Salmonella enterica subsp. enterica serovar Cerro]ECV6025827.1 hypothetical protein [Salmonella enterica]EDA5911898.1 hypothetical protein [Salmonella enterica subsp. enterica serovar Cerro]
MLKTIEYLIVIVKSYHVAVFDRFKRYDEPQKELNPINWLAVVLIAFGSGELTLRRITSQSLTLLAFSGYRGRLSWIDYD